MDPVIAKLIENLPSAGAVILVVVYFLRAIDRIITQFQQIEKERDEQWRNVFDGQREALNIIAAHIKTLSEFLMQHDGWERKSIETIIGNQEQILESQRAIITRKIKTARSAQSK